jgi:hypothetical protein
MRLSGTGFRIGQISLKAGEMAAFRQNRDGLAR